MSGNSVRLLVWKEEVVLRRVQRVGQVGFVFLGVCPLYVLYLHDFIMFFLTVRDQKVVTRHGLIFSPDRTLNRLFELIIENTIENGSLIK